MDDSGRQWKVSEPVDDGGRPRTNPDSAMNAPSTDFAQVIYGLAYQLRMLIGERGLIKAATA